jgi:oxygen-independent coproporphyrinogen-3 oxidase
VLSSDAEIQAVLNRILDDSEMLLRKLGSPEIRTLFIGGGTPSAIPGDLLANFLNRLNKSFSNSPKESTIELNPETVTEELLIILEDNEINRISVGVQSLDDGILKTLGRNIDTAATLKALDTIKRYWKGSISFDLINSVPGQDVDTALSDIKRINKFDPGHISLYSLTFEPSTKLYSMLKAGRIQILSESVDSVMQKESIDLLKSLSFKRYEISNYTNDGKQSLHNLNYWNMGSYVGIGPSAASTMMTDDGPLRIGYKRDISTFLEQNSIEDRVELELLNPNSFLLEHLLMGFRLLKGIDTSHISKVFNFNIENYLKPLFSRWNDKLIITEDSIRLTEEGLSLLNPFLVDIAALIDKSPLEISISDINWPLETT